MATQEESFPRGGSEKKKRERIESLPKEKDLFKTSIEASKAKKRKGEKQEERVKKRKFAKEEHFYPSTSHAELLTFKSIADGMLVLGRIKEVHDYELVVSLPNGLFGTVPITAVCDTYTQLLQQLASENDMTGEKSEELTNLHTIFHVGGHVRCKVLEVANQTEGKKEIKLSINPKDVHEGLAATSLRAGMCLCGCVCSREDHGYMVDLGIRGIQAFLPNKAVDHFVHSCNKGEPLQVGSYLHCRVQNTGGDAKSGTRRIVTVTINPQKVMSAMLTPQMKVPFDSLLPGMVVMATVSKIQETGVSVKFLGYQGEIHKTHLHTDPKNLSAQQEVKASILYINPTTKSVTLTLLPHLVTPDLSHKKQFEDLSVGDILEKAALWKVDMKRGVYFKLGDKLVGFARTPQLKDGPVKNIHKEFRKGKHYSCRVLDFDYVDDVVMLTLKESVLTQQFLSLRDIEPASVIKCEIRGLHENGISVSVTNQIRGFIPRNHLADVLLRHPEKKFKVGNKIKCKVLIVDPSTKKLFLTHKKSMVTSKLPSVTSFDQCQRGMTIDGFISKVLNHGVVVTFYNGIRGWVPRKELSTQRIEYPDKVFYVGQVVTCRIISSTPQEEKLLLTFKIAGKSSFGTKEAKVPEDFVVGKLVDCRVVKTTEKGLDVVLMSSELPAFLPMMHLSDYPQNAELLQEVYKPGDVIKEAMYLNKGSFITVSHKESLINAARQNSFVKDFDQLKPGMLLPGFLRKVMSYGVFVDLTNGLVGLAPNKFLCDRKMPDQSSLYQEGQSLIAKVTEVDQEKRRFLVSLRGSDCYGGDTSVSIDLLASCLTERRKIISAKRSLQGDKQPLLQLEPGQLVSVKVTKVTDQGALLLLNGKVKGVATYEHITAARCTEGATLPAVVLYVDIQLGCFEASLQPELVKAVKHRKENKFSKVMEGQVIKSEVLLIKDDFVLVALKAHAVGRLAYVPAKQHMNDVLEKRQFVTWQVNQVVVKKRVSGNEILACLKIHEDEANEEIPRGRLVVERHALELGMVTEAQVKAVLPLQMNVLIGKTPGRVPVSEVLDEVKQGCSPFADFKEGMTVKVKIIGFRDVRSFKPLTLKNANQTRSLPECTLKPSKLAREGFHESEAVVGHSFKVGDKVSAFVLRYNNHCLWMQVTPTVRGKVYVTNMSDNLKFLENPNQHFKEGHGYSATVTEATDPELLELSLTGIPSAITEGATVKGFIIGIHDRFGLTIQLSQGYKGHVALTDISDQYKNYPTEDFHKNQFVECCVVQCDREHKDKCILSLRNSRLKSSRKQKAQDGEIRDREIRDLDDIQPDDIIRGFVAHADKNGTFVSLSRDITSRVQFHHMSEYFIKDVESAFLPGKLVTAKVLSIDRESEKVELSLLEEDTGVPEDIPKELLGSKRKAVDSASAKKTPEKHKKKKKKKNEEKPRNAAQKRKLEQEVPSGGSKKQKIDTEDGDSGVDVAKDSESETEMLLQSPKKKKRTVSTESAPRLCLSAGFSWDTSFQLPETSGGKQQSDSDESDTEEEESQPKQSKHEKKKEARQQEKEIYERERQLLDADRCPETTEDFDRLVLQSPNSSIVWTRYMAFHLQTAEIEKARVVAERALKTITFREEQEKLNIWVAYMNLENMYGTPESLTQVFQRALQQNDAIQVFQQLINIYSASGKIEATEQLYQKMVKRFSLNRDVWVSFGTFYFKNGQAESARKLMQRSLKSLEKRNHVETIAKFAQMEFKFGDPGRGQTMFGNILGTYPKRTDLWSVYLDMMIKQGNPQPVRQLFEQVINMKFSAKKMKFFFKKYLDYEQKHGSEETAEAVRRKALEYVESRTESL